MELEKTSEARRKAQRSGEEDPIVVAQRFLNIYRQIHIFNNEKKQIFNKMLLELSPQVRGMFGQLPGGALLQDYVDELADQEGIEKSIQTTNVEIADDDVKQAKILATALAEAQVQATTKMQELGVPQVIQTPTITTGEAKLSLDKGFAEDFAQAMSGIIIKNNENQNNEITQILNSLGQFQTDAIKNMQQENSNQWNEIKNIVQTIITNQQLAQANKNQSETKQLVELIIENQKSINEKIDKLDSSPETIYEQMATLWHRSEQNMGKLVAFLNEKQRKDSLDVANMINESQQKLWTMMLQANNVNQNSGNASANNNIQINSSDYSAVLNNIADKLGALNSTPQKIEFNFPENVFSEIIKSQSQIYRQIASEQTQELSKIMTSVLKETQKASVETITDVLRMQPISFVNAPNTNYQPEPKFTEAITDSTESYVQEDTLPTTEAETPKKKKKKKKKKKNIPLNPLFSSLTLDDDDSSDEDEQIADTTENIVLLDETQIDNNDTFQALENQDNPSPENSFELSFNDWDNLNFDNLEDNEIPSESEITHKPESTYDSEPISESEKASSSPDEFAETKQELSQIFDWDFNEDETISTIYNPLSENMVSDWGFGDGDEKENDVNASNAEEDKNDWEWEYIEEEASFDENQELIPIAQNSLIQSGDLFFQQPASIPLSQSDYYPINMKRTPTIVDSALNESSNIDPY